MNEPPFRFSTQRALDELEVELNLKTKNPFWESMAGVSYTPGNPSDLHEYLDHYVKLLDDDKRFTLMEMIMDALAAQPSESDFHKFWNKVRVFLLEDYAIHEYTIFYWMHMVLEFPMSRIMTPAVCKLVSEMNSRSIL